MSSLLESKTFGHSRQLPSVGGERRLEQIMRDSEGRRATELSQLLQAEIRAWRPSSMAQQDDLTLIL
jgi:hypothetical protein